MGQLWAESACTEFESGATRSHCRTMTGESRQLQTDDSPLMDGPAPISGTGLQTRSSDHDGRGSYDFRPCDRGFRSSASPHQPHLPSGRTSPDYSDAPREGRCAATLLAGADSELNRRTPPTADDASAPDGPREQRGPAVQPGLGEDRLQVILHGVRRQEHAVRELPGVRTGREQAQQLTLRAAQSMPSGEQRGAVGGRGLIDGDSQLAVGGERGAAAWADSYSMG